MKIHHISALSKAPPCASPLSDNSQKFFELTYAALRAIAKMGSDVYTLDFITGEEETAAVIAAIKERASSGDDVPPSTISPSKSAGFSYASETAKARREVVSFLTRNATRATSGGPADVSSSSSSSGAAAAAAPPPTAQLLTSTITKHFIAILPSSTTATSGGISPTLVDLMDSLSLVTGIHVKDLRILFSPPCSHLSKIVTAPAPTATAVGEGATTNSSTGPRSENPQPSSSVSSSSSAPSKQLPAEVSLRAENFGSMVRVTVSHRQKNENNSNTNTSSKTKESSNKVEDIVVEVSATPLSSPTGANPSSSATAAAPSSLSTKPHVMILGKQTRLGIIGEAVHYYLNSLAKPSLHGGHSHSHHSHSHHHAPHHPDSSKNKINNATDTTVADNTISGANNKDTHDGLATASAAFSTSLPSGGSQTTALKERGTPPDEYAPDHVVIEQLLRQQNASWAKQVITNSAVMMRDVMDHNMSGGEEGASPEGGGRTDEGEEPDASNDKEEAAVRATASKGGEADTRAKKKSRRELKQESSIRRQLRIAKAQQTALLDLIMVQRNNPLLDQQQQQPEQADTEDDDGVVINKKTRAVCDPLYVATVLSKKRPLTDGEVLAAARYWATVGDRDQSTYRRAKNGLVACHRLIMLDPFEHVFPDHSFVGSGGEEDEEKENTNFNSSRVDAAGIISRLYPTLASEEIFLRTSGSFSRVFWGHLVAEAAMGGAWAALFKLEKECKEAIQRVLDEFHNEARSIDEDKRKARVAASRRLKNSSNGTTTTTQQGHQEEQQNSETAHHNGTSSPEEAREGALKIRIQKAVAPILAKYAMNRGTDSANRLQQQDQQPAADGEGLEDTDTQQRLLLQRRFNRTAKREMLKLLRLFGKSCTRAFRKLRDVDVREEELMRKEDMEEEERRKRIKKRNMENKKKNGEKTANKKKLAPEEPGQSGSDDGNNNNKKGAKNAVATKQEEIGDDTETSTNAKRRRTEPTQPTTATSAPVAAPLSWMAHAQPNKTSPFVATTDKGQKKEVLVVGGQDPSSKNIRKKDDKDNNDLDFNEEEMDDSHDDEGEEDDFDFDDEEYDEDESYEDFDIDAYLDDADDDDEAESEEDEEAEYNLDGLMDDVKDDARDYERQFEDNYEEGDEDEDEDYNDDDYDGGYDDDNADADDALLREYLQGAPATLQALNSAYLQSIEEHKTEAGLNALETVAALHELILTRKFDDNPLAAGLNFKPLYESGKGNNSACAIIKKHADPKSQHKEDEEDDSPVPGIGEWRVPLMLTCSHSLPTHAPRFSASCRTCVERGLTTAEHRLCAVCALTCHAGHTILWREATVEGPRPQQHQNQNPSMIVNNSGAPLISPFVCDCPTDAFKEYGLPRDATPSIAAAMPEQCDESDETTTTNTNSEKIKKKQRDKNLLVVSSKTHYAHACRYVVISGVNECPLKKKETLLEGGARIELLINAAEAVSKIKLTEEAEAREKTNDEVKEDASTTNATSSSKQSSKSDAMEKDSASDIAAQAEAELMFENSVSTARKVIDDVRRVADVMLTRYPREKGNRYPGQRQLSSRVKVAERKLLLCREQQEDSPNTDLGTVSNRTSTTTTTVTAATATATTDGLVSASSRLSPALQATANADAMSRMCYCNSSSKSISSSQSISTSFPSPSNAPYSSYQGVGALINTSLPTPELPVLSTIVHRIVVETKGVLTPTATHSDEDGGKGSASTLCKSTNSTEQFKNSIENNIVSCVGCNDLFDQDHLAALDGRHVKSMGCHGRLPAGKHAVAFRCRTCIYEPGVGSRAYLRERRVKERQQAHQKQEQQKRTASASATSGSATKSGKSGRTSKLFSSFSSSTRPLRSATAPASSEPLLTKSKIKKAAIEALDRLASHDANSETNTYNPYNLLIPNKVVTSLQKGLLVCAPCAFRCHLGQGHDVDLSTAYVYRSYASTLAGGDASKKEVVMKSDTKINALSLSEEATAGRNEQKSVVVSNSLDSSSYSPETTLAGRGLTIGLDGVHENGNDHTSAQLWASMALCASKALTDETMAIEESVRNDCYHVKSRAPSEAECTRVNNPDKRKVNQSTSSSVDAGAAPPLLTVEERFLSTPTETIFFGKDEGECGIYAKLLLKDRERKQLEAFNEKRMRVAQFPLQPSDPTAATTTASTTTFANQLPTYDANHLVGFNPSHIVDDGNGGDLRRITTFQNRPYRSPQEILALLGGQDDEVGREMIAQEYVQPDFPTFGTTSSSSSATTSANNMMKSADSGKPSFDDEEDLNDEEDPKFPFVVESSELEELAVLLDEALAAANSALRSPQTSSASPAVRQPQNLGHLRVVDGTHLMRAQNVVFAQAAKEGFIKRRLAAKQRYLSQYEKVENIHKPIRGGGAGSSLLSGLNNLASPNTSASARSALADLLTNGERSADGKEILIRQDDEASMSALMGLFGGQGNIPPPPSMLHSDRSRQIEEMKEMYMETFSPQTIERVDAKKRKKKGSKNKVGILKNNKAGKVASNDNDICSDNYESESDNHVLSGSNGTKGTRKGARSSGGGVKSPLAWRDEVPPPNVYALPDLYPDILTGNNEEFGDDYWTNFDGSQTGFVCGCQSAQLLEQFIRDQKLLQRRKVILPNPSSTQVGGEGTPPPSGSTAGSNVVVVGNSPFVCQIGLVPSSATSNGQPLFSSSTSASSSSVPSGPIPYSSFETSTTAEELLAMFSTSCAVPPVVGFGEGNDLTNPRAAMLRAQQEVTHIGGDQRLTFESYQALQDSLFISLMVLPDSDLSHLQKLLQNDEEMSGGDTTGVGSSLVSKVLGLGVGCSRNTNSATISGNGAGDSGINDDKAFGVAGGSGADSATILASATTATSTACGGASHRFLFGPFAIPEQNYEDLWLADTRVTTTQQGGKHNSSSEALCFTNAQLRVLLSFDHQFRLFCNWCIEKQQSWVLDHKLSDCHVMKAILKRKRQRRAVDINNDSGDQSMKTFCWPTCCGEQAVALDDGYDKRCFSDLSSTPHEKDDADDINYAYYYPYHGMVLPANPFSDRYVCSPATCCGRGLPLLTYLSLDPNGSSCYPPATSVLNPHMGGSLLASPQPSQSGGASSKLSGDSNNDHREDDADLLPSLAPVQSQRRSFSAEGRQVTATTTYCQGFYDYIDPDRNGAVDSVFAVAAAASTSPAEVGQRADEKYDIEMAGIGIRGRLTSGCSSMLRDRGRAKGSADRDVHTTYVYELLEGVRDGWIDPLTCGKLVMRGSEAEEGSKRGSNNTPLSYFYVPNTSKCKGNALGKNLQSQHHDERGYVVGEEETIQRRGAHAGSFGSMVGGGSKSQSTLRLRSGAQVSTFRHHHTQEEAYMCSRFVPVNECKNCACALPVACAFSCAFCAMPELVKMVATKKAAEEAVKKHVAKMKEDRQKRIAAIAESVKKQTQSNGGDVTAEAAVGEEKDEKKPSRIGTKRLREEESEAIAKETVASTEEEKKKEDEDANHKNNNAEEEEKEGKGEAKTDFSSDRQTQSAPESPFSNKSSLEEIDLEASDFDDEDDAHDDMDVYGKEGNKARASVISIQVEREVDAYDDDDAETHEAVGKDAKEEGKSSELGTSSAKDSEKNVATRSNNSKKRFITETAHVTLPDLRSVMKTVTADELLDFLKSEALGAHADKLGMLLMMDSLRGAGGEEEVIFCPACSEKPFFERDVHSDIDHPLFPYLKVRQITLLRDAIAGDYMRGSFLGDDHRVGSTGVGEPSPNHGGGRGAESGMLQPASDSSTTDMRGNQRKRRREGGGEDEGKGFILLPSLPDPIPVSAEAAAANKKQERLALINKAPQSDTAAWLSANPSSGTPSTATTPSTLSADAEMCSPESAALSAPNTPAENATERSTTSATIPDASASGVCAPNLPPTASSSKCDDAGEDVHATRIAHLQKALKELRRVAKSVHGTSSPAHDYDASLGRTLAAYAAEDASLFGTQIKVISSTSEEAKSTKQQLQQQGQSLLSSLFSSASPSVSASRPLINSSCPYLSPVERVAALRDVASLNKARRRVVLSYSPASSGSASSSKQVNAQQVGQGDTSDLSEEGNRESYTGPKDETK